MARETEEHAAGLPPRRSLRRRLARWYVEAEAARYVLSASVVLAAMLLIPDLLNNMLLTAALLLAGVALLPEYLRKHL
ncbi:MAG TPA: hypothetical protein VNN10_15265 [Dehalococcoidia bacterium]|nr:hypothetical protein [Dehalococcoidia bacterium]